MKITFLSANIFNILRKISLILRVTQALLVFTYVFKSRSNVLKLFKKGMLVLVFLGHEHISIAHILKYTNGVEFQTTCIYTNLYEFILFSSIWLKARISFKVNFDDVFDEPFGGEFQMISFRFHENEFSRFVQSLKADSILGVDCRLFQGNNFLECRKWNVCFKPKEVSFWWLSLGSSIFK